jgi:hypothetical protein
MNRRGFITLLGSAGAVWPRSACCQVSDVDDSDRIPDQ